MKLLLTTFEAVATLFVFGIIGFFVISKKVLPEKALTILSKLAIDIALPCLVFSRIIENFEPQEMERWWLLPIWWLVFTACIFVFTMIISMIFIKREIRPEFKVTLFYQNGIFFPLAIISGIFGESSPYLVDLFLFTIFFSAFFFNTYFYFFKKERKRSGFNLKILLNPILLATLLSLGLVLLGVASFIPTFFISAFKNIGGMAIPILMLIFGGNIFIDFRNRGKIQIFPVIEFIFFKNILIPGITLLILWALKMEYGLALIFFIQSVVPPITSAPIVTQRAGGKVSVVNQFMVASFLICLITIPLFMMFFDKLIK